MKAMWAGFLTAIIIAIGANYILGEIGFSTADRQTSPAVRLE